MSVWLHTVMPDEDARALISWIFSFPFLPKSGHLVTQCECICECVSCVATTHAGTHTPICYCDFLSGFSRAVNSCFARTISPNFSEHLHLANPSLICSPLSSGDLCHFNPASLLLVNKEILCQLSPGTSCWESNGESKWSESLSHQREAAGLIKWTLCPASNP